MVSGRTNSETRVIIVAHPVKKRRMCQHLKRAVARRALIRDDQNPLPFPVKGSTPECIAWEGITAVIPGVSIEKSEGGGGGSLHRCLAPVIYTCREYFEALSGWNQIRTPRNGRSCSVEGVSFSFIATKQRPWRSRVTTRIDMRFQNMATPLTTPPPADSLQCHCATPA